MKVVVDTNVVAYYLLKTEPFHEEARDFWHAIRQPMAPAFWAAEFANTVWVVTRAGAIGPADALERLRLAGLLGIESVDVTTLWAGAVSRAIDAGHPAYDTLFVELAHRESAPLATFDKKVLDRFPDVAHRPAQLVE